MKRSGLGLLVLLLVVPAVAQAGIVITKKGNVFIGRIEAEDVNEKTVTIRDPRLLPGAPAAKGNQTFDRKDIRWFDQSAEVPTDPYFKRFLDEPLDPAWSKHAEDYRERMKNRTDVPDIRFVPRLVALPFTQIFRKCEASIRWPIGWNRSEANGIVVFESADKRARIHVFASDLTGERALTVARAALEKYGVRIDATGVAGNDWEASCERKGRVVKSLRRIVQTEKSTAFAVAYAEERDWPKVASLLRESLDTLRAREQ